MKEQNNQHFSHNHLLTQLKLSQNESLPCNMCNLQITEPFHGCLNCNHYLHESCLNTPRSLSHPAHFTHPLALHSTPTYPSRSFSCDACGSEGENFTLCCAHCEFDLHVPCANSRLKIHVNNHPHDLKLLFQSPFKNSKNIETGCHICGGMINKKYWLYLCHEGVCNFGAHIDCVNGKTMPKAVASTKMLQHGDGSSSTVSSAVEDIDAITKAQQELYAAQAIAQIQLQANRAAINAGEFRLSLHLICSAWRIRWEIARLTFFITIVTIFYTPSVDTLNRINLGLSKFVIVIEMWQNLYGIC